jgi:hypothetical protein
MYICFTKYKPYFLFSTLLKILLINISRNKKNTKFLFRHFKKYSQDFSEIFAE